MSGLFVAGGAIAGVDTGTIFIENGRFHGEKIIEAIAKRDVATCSARNSIYWRLANVDVYRVTIP